MQMAMEEKNRHLLAEIEQRDAMVRQKQAEFEIAAAERAQMDAAQMQANMAAHVSV
jgi:hypothetical protein